MKPIAKKNPAIWFPTIRTGTGTDVFTETLAEGLQKRGHQVDITWLPHRTEYAPWTVAIPNAPTWANIIHTNTRLHPRFLKGDLPIVSTMHLCVHDPVLTKYKSFLQKIYHKHWVKPIETKILNNSSSVIAVSQYTAKKTSSIFNIEDIKVIYNGIDHNVFKAHHRTVPRNPFRLLYVGSWSARKGVDLLGPILNQLGSDFELLYTGTDKKNLPDNTRCIGHLRSSLELIQAYQSADALLFPTRLEGFGLVALEAQACGIPVIATRGSSVIEVVEDGITASLCTQDDVSSFVEAVKKYAQNHNYWRQNGQAGQVRSVKHFDIERMIDRYIFLYREIIRKCNKNI